MMPPWDQGLWDQGAWDDDPPPPPPILTPSKKRKTNHKTMASNPTPDDDKVLIALAEDMADGCNLHEVAIGILHNKEAAIRAAITAASQALVAAGLAEAQEDNKQALLTTADAAGAKVLKDCRLRMVKLFGATYNANWKAAGWPGDSTMVPRTQNERFTLLSTQGMFFTQNPSAESVEADATASLCTAAHTAVSNARSAMNAAESNATTAAGAMKAAMQALRKRVRGLITELEDLIADDDPRWEAFGLNIPANPSAPEGISQLTATPAGDGKIHAVWSYATRSTGNRLLTKRTTGQTIDPDFINSGRTPGLEKTLEDFEPGTIVLVKVVPYNDGGDGGESPTVSVTVT